jgi:tetratricopeptide (TPR) repeat protein
MAYEQVADYGAALLSYRKAVQLCPDFPELYVKLASFCVRQGLYDDAFQAAETGLTKRPLSLVANPVPGSLERLDALNKASLNEVLAEVYGARGMYAEASKLLGERKLIGAEIAATEQRPGRRFAVACATPAARGPSSHGRAGADVKAHQEPTIRREFDSKWLRIRSQKLAAVGCCRDHVPSGATKRPGRLGKVCCWV